MAWSSKIPTAIRVPVLIGFLGLGIGVLGFGYWAATAPLEGAVIANGTVVASGRNKVVQHLEGGIVQSIFVEEGQRVKAGEPMLLLDSTDAEVTRNRLKGQLDQLYAVEARAIAERDELEELIFPAELVETSKTDPSVETMLRDQRAEFEAGIKRFSSEVAILQKRKSALEEEILGLDAQVKAAVVQLELIQEEKLDAEQLLSQNLSRKSRVLELRRSEALLIGQRGQFMSQIAKARQAILESEQQLQRLRAQRLQDATAKLAEVRLQRSDLNEQMRSAQDRLDRVQVLAPVSGTVINLSKTGEDAVISPGEVLMEIVPEGVELIVEARIQPADIDQVWQGQDARLVFSALNPQEVSPVSGKVVHISADSILDSRTGTSYYLSRLQIGPDFPADFDASTIGPGQPVEAFITTGERTLLAYVVEPLVSTVRRSFREN